MLRPHIKLLPAQTIPRQPPSIDLVPHEHHTTALSQFLAAARASHHPHPTERQPSARPLDTTPAYARPHPADRCCVYCGHSLYTPPKVTRVRCPCCTREIPVLDISLAGDIQKAEEILTAGKITVAMGARVAADLVAGSIEIFGKVLGDVLASQACRIRCTAKLSGRILCRQLIIEPGAEVEGLVETIDEPRESR